MDYHKTRTATLQSGSLWMHSAFRNLYLFSTHTGFGLVENWFWSNVAKHSNSSICNISRQFGLRKETTIWECTMMSIDIWTRFDWMLLRSVWVTKMRFFWQVMRREGFGEIHTERGRKLESWKTNNIMARWKEGRWKVGRPTISWQEKEGNWTVRRPTEKMQNWRSVVCTFHWWWWWLSIKFQESIFNKKGFCFPPPFHPCIVVVHQDTPDKFQWKWTEMDQRKVAETLPVELSKELSTVPVILRIAKEGEDNRLLQLLETGLHFYYYYY